jgi:uncharacterized protein YacL
MSYLFFIILGIIFLALLVTRRLLHLETSTLILGVLGIILGAIIGALFSVPLSRLPGVWGQWLPTVITIILAGILGTVFVFQKNKVSQWYNQSIFRKIEDRLLKIESRLGKVQEKEKEVLHQAVEEGKEIGGIIVDTSVLIDGRLEGIVNAGFILDKLIIPQFILKELQSVADSPDALKRNRGRRGLEILNSIKKSKKVKVEFPDIDYPKIKEVDEKILKLAKEKKAKILTVDFNLNQVASVQGIEVLNINELANAVKTILLPGEEIKIKIVQEGKEKNQGVGYLEDGTMVVVEDGKDLVGKEVEVVVERVFQTVAGVMIFTHLKK